MWAQTHYYSRLTCLTCLTCFHFWIQKNVQPDWDIFQSCLHYLFSVFDHQRSDVARLSCWRFSVAINYPRPYDRELILDTFAIDDAFMDSLGYCHNTYSGRKIA